MSCYPFDEDFDESTNGVEDKFFTHLKPVLTEVQVVAKYFLFVLFCFSLCQIWHFARYLCHDESA